MKRLLIIGCGDVALRAIPLLTQRYRVFALIRNPAKAKVLCQLGVTPIFGDLDERTSLTKIRGLADEVLHLAPPPNVGDDDPRTTNLLANLSQGKLPKRVIYISTSGVYGDCQGEIVHETRPCRAQTPRAQRRVAAEQCLRSWAIRNHVTLGILRVPGIYAADRLPASRLQQPCVIQEQDSYTNHIHADDLAAICLAALQRASNNRIYHACDNSQLKMGDYFDLIADHFQQPRPPRVSRAEAQQLLSPSLLSFMNESRRLLNQRMLQELKVRLRYPTVADFLKNY